MKPEVYAPLTIVPETAPVPTLLPSGDLMPQTITTWDDLIEVARIHHETRGPLVKARQEADIALAQMSAEFSGQWSESAAIVNRCGLMIAQFLAEHADELLDLPDHTRDLIYGVAVAKPGRSSQSVEFLPVPGEDGDTSEVQTMHDPTDEEIAERIEQVLRSPSQRARYIVTKRTISKTTILRDYRAHTLSNEMLDRMGIVVVLRHATPSVEYRPK